MRLFLAIPVEGEAADRLQAVQRHLKIGRHVDRDDFHVTLVFLGDVGRAAAEDLHDALEGMVLPPVALEIAGIGHFGRETPRAVWAGVRPSEALSRVQGKLAQAARSVGITVERRKFVPHVTLARMKGRVEDAGEVAAFASRFGDLACQAEVPEAVVLYRSHLGSGGPVYEALAEYPLG